MRIVIAGSMLLVLGALVALSAFAIYRVRRHILAAVLGGIFLILSCLALLGYSFAAPFYEVINGTIVEYDLGAFLWVLAFVLPILLVSYLLLQLSKRPVSRG